METTLSAPGILRSDVSLFNPEDAVIKMRKIIKKFKTAIGEVTVLKGIDTAFYPSEFVGVVGKSGSGKSTLVNMLTGIDRPTSGEVEIGNTLVHKLNESQMARWRGVNLGIVFQFYQLMPMLTLLENTMLPMDIAKKYAPAERETRALSLLKMVGLEKQADKMPAAVSGGQQQAAAIARALANAPPFIVADAPTGNLDSKTAENIFQIFENLVTKGKTIIMVTHDPNLAQRTSRTLTLCDGEIIDPNIAAALPQLSHPQMLKATHHSQVRHYRPGELILSEGQPVNEFFIITRGTVEVRNGHPRPIQIGPGGYFGDTALLKNQPIKVSINAGVNESVEVLAIEGSIFTEIVNASRPTKEMLTTAANMHGAI